MTRRRLLAGAAAVGVLGGVGFGVWRAREPEAPPEVDAFWRASFETPQGPALAAASLKGRPLLLNFWATWCPPCVEEFPLLDAFFREHKGNGWQVLGLAIDQPSKVKGFLAKTPVTFPIGLAGLEGTELARGLGNMAGGLPFTVVFGAGGAVLHRRMGRVSESDLRAWSALR